MRVFVGLSIAVIMSAGALCAAPLTIVKDGESRTAIIAAANEPHAQKAAEDIQKYLEKISGARLDIVPEGSEEPPGAQRIRIYVGHTTMAGKKGIDIPSGFDASIRPEAFEEEGYVLRTRDNDIFIGGNSDGPYRGTLYAAYAFLERLGCRFYFPGEWGEIVPKLKTVTVPHLDVESRPDFPVRYISIGGGWVATTAEESEISADWYTKVGFQTAPNGPYPLVGDGFLGLLLPFNEYWEKHPEYYAMDEHGQRNKPDSDYSAMLCLSNPDVFTQSVKNIREAFEGKREGLRASPNGFGISAPDGSPYCYCDNCLANSQNFEYPNYVYGRQMSEEFFGFAVKLAREFPDKYVATMAYSLREMPPQGVTLLPNMTVMYAPISCCALHPANDPSCWRRQEFVEILKQWRRQTPHVYLYEYQPNFLTGLFVPERGMANMTANIPIYKEIGIKGISAEGRKAFMQTWLTYYVAAKLLWDAETDVDALQKEFYTSFFGADAGPHVRAWWDACEQALLDATVHVHEDFLVNHVYNVKFTKSIHRFVEAALKAPATGEQRKRVEAFALIADHLEAYADMEEADMNMDYAAAAKAAGHMDEDEQKLHEAYSFFISPNTSEPPLSFMVRGRKKKYEELAATINGTTGSMVAPLPLAMRFVHDRFNEGVIGEWYASDFDDEGWGTKNTFFTWDAQDIPEDEQGHDYDGYGWYRGTFEVPQEFNGKPIHFHCGGALNEAWVWVNGRYVGHSQHKVWWWHPHDFDLDVTDFVKPGTTNTVAIRVWNKAEIGGLFRRGFFWSPKDKQQE